MAKTHKSTSKRQQPTTVDAPALIARSKLVLNVHFYQAQILEMVRISYLLANRCAVLSEPSADPAEDAALAGGVAFSDTAGLAALARRLLDRPEERDRLALAGYRIMRLRHAGTFLRTALDKAFPHGSSESPRTREGA